MSIFKQTAALMGALALVFAPLSGASAENPPKKHYHRHIVPVGCPVHRIADGSLVDCHGWRLHSGSIGWDNSCFNLDYLPSEFACSAKGHR